MIYSTRYADGTDLDRLQADLRRYEAILAVNGVQGEAGNNDGDENHIRSDSEDDNLDEDGDIDDEDESSDEFDWEAYRRRREQARRMEQAREYHRLNEIDEQ